MKKLFLLLVCYLFGYQGIAQESVEKFGVYAGLTQNAFYRSSFPSNPFSSHSLYSFETGVHMALYQNPKVSGRLWLGYGNMGAKESFTGGQNDLESTVTLPSIRLTAIPVIYTLKVSRHEVSLGAGVFAAYHLDQKFEVSGAESFFIDPDRWSSLSYGLQLQVGIRYQRYMLHLNVFNSLNKIATAEFGDSFIKTQGSSLTLSYLF